MSGGGATPGEEGVEVLVGARVYLPGVDVDGGSEVGTGRERGGRGWGPDGGLSGGIL